MILQIRTKDNLETLLEQGNSPAWVIAEERVPEITSVEIYQFDGKKVLKADFDADKSTRTDSGRLVVAFTNGVIEDADHDWNGQNPVRYKSIHQNDNLKSGEDAESTLISSLKKIDPNDTVFINMDIINLIEIEHREGAVFDKKFTCDVEIVSDLAPMVQCEIVVSNLLDKLQNKIKIEELSYTDFQTIMINEAGPRSYSPPSNILWETALDEKEKKELLDSNFDYEGNSEYLYTTIKFKSGTITPKSIEGSDFNIKITK